MPKNIFSNDPTGPGDVQDPTHFRPDVTVIFRASSFPGQAKWLARVSPGNNVNWPDFGDGFFIYVFHVVEQGDLGPVLLQHLLAEVIGFAQRHGFESARAFQPQTETADAAEQVQQPVHASLPHVSQPSLPPRANISSLGVLGYSDAIRS